jgi:hypothetical protein
MDESVLRLLCHANGRVVDIERRLAEPGDSPDAPPPSWNKFGPEARELARRILERWLGPAGAELMAKRFERQWIVFLPRGEAILRFEEVEAWALAQSPWSEKLVPVDTTRLTAASGSGWQAFALTPAMLVIALFAFILACVLLMGKAFLCGLAVAVAGLGLRLDRVRRLRTLLREKGYQSATFRQAFALERNARRLGARPRALARLPRLEDLGATPSFNPYLLVESLTEAIRTREAIRARGRAADQP